MRKGKLILVLAMLVFTGNLFAQWTTISHPAKSFSFTKLTPQKFLIFTTDSYTISTNAGNSWSLPKPLPYSLVDPVQFFDSLNGWALDGSYQNTGILRTTNGGNSWQKITAPTTSTVYTISFGSKLIGVGGGYNGLIIKTSNGGLNWTLSSIPNAGTINTVKMVNSNTVFVIYSNNDSLLKSTDRGTTWKNVFLGGGQGFRKLFFLDSLNGYCLGNTGFFFKTTDAGENWIRTTIPAFGNTLNMFFINIQTGWVTDTQGKIYMTTNAGQTWNLVRNTPNVSNNFEAYLFDINFKDVNTGWALGDRGRILKTINGGVNWTNFSEPPDGITSLFFKDSENGFILCATSTFTNTTHPISKIYKTTNRGLNWEMVKSFLNITLNDLKYINGKMLLCGNEGKFYRSSDDGVTWDTSTVSNINFISMSFLNDNTGWLCSNNGTVFKTLNGGSNWSSVSVTTTQTLNKIYFMDNQNGYCCAFGGYYITTNGGNNWEFKSVGSNCNFSDITFTDLNTGYLAGTANPYFDRQVYKTTNAGTNWTFVVNDAGFIFTPYYVNSITFFDRFNGILVWDRGVKITNDAGQTWGSVSFPIYPGIYEAFTRALFINSEQLYIGASDGTLVSSFPISSIHTISNTVTINSYSLHQNYPNPFNPSTKINYEIKSAGFVSLKVFNLLGKEVAVLVNEKQNAGSYAVDFNSSEYNLPSGIYFYTLIAGEFKETKKMVLAK